MAESLTMEVIDGGDEVLLYVAVPKGGSAVFSAPKGSKREDVLWNLKAWLDREGVPSAFLSGREGG